ncbi:unnamed protein product [Plutella xylostella]|uniref:(diamondback moth) hypothetical protein n=1 Tax=Plutella xylostella TaxID=51655 RepID=A0A8S4G928_PLUXY|nr:unnamed protein product [Plutella xylostella]
MRRPWTGIAGRPRERLLPSSGSQLSWETPSHILLGHTSEPEDKSLLQPVHLASDDVWGRNVDTVVLVYRLKVAQRAMERAMLGGHVIPRGKTLCHIHIFDLHRRADLYPEPLVFNPERFTAGNCASRHPYAYIPFSGGPRNCIGQRFAMLEMKSAVSAVLRRYRLLPVTTPDQLQFSADLVLRTTHPVYVRFQRRH